MSKVQSSHALKRTVLELATQHYIFSVQERMGGISFGKLHKHFCKQDFKTNAEYNNQQSRIFYKYSKGKVCIKNAKLITRIEEELPGTKRLLSHPIWLILANPSADLETIYTYMHQLNGYIQEKLFKQDKQTKNYQRKTWVDTVRFSQISMRNDIDALACFLMLIREFEILEMWHAYVTAKWFAQELFLRLTHFSPFLKINTKLYSVIYSNFFDRNNPLTSNHFHSDVLFKAINHYLKSPSFIPNLAIYNSLFKSLLELAKNIGINANTKSEQIDFLFWVFEFKLYVVLSALEEESDRSPHHKIIINSLNAAYADTNKYKHLNKSSVLLKGNRSN